MDDDDAEIICGRLGDPIQPPSPLVNLRVLLVEGCQAMKSLFKKSERVISPLRGTRVPGLGSGVAKKSRTRGPSQPEPRNAVIEEEFTRLRANQKELEEHLQQERRDWQERERQLERERQDRDRELLKFEVRGEELAEVVLGQLESMKLSYMDKLMHIWRMVPRRIQGFHNLRKLEVQSGQKLRYLLSPLVAKMVVNLQHLKLTNCRMIEQVIRTEEEEKKEEDIFEINMIDKIVFPQLCVLSLEELENLRMFCIRRHNFELPLLE
ncbi:hypothetical protein LguiB_005435 [Lonicera macranthoides]